MKKVLLTQILYLIVMISLNAQTLVNEVWSNSFGEPDQFTTPNTVWDEINWTASTISSQDELIVVGNTKLANGTTDIITTKSNNDGTIIWEKTFTSSSNSSDYGIATILDNNGNIITAGVTSNNNLTTDIVILKYSPNGTLIWSSIIGANNNQFDVPTTISSDLGGNIFVASGSLNSSSETDWVVAKLNTNGILQWNVSYDFAGQHEIPVAIQLEDNGNLLVQGVSGSTPISYDLVEVEFAELSGAILSEDRTEIPNLSVDDVFDISKDNENNFYLVGSTKDNGNEDQVFQLVKINTDFEIEWIRKVDIEGFNDVAKSIVIDNDGEIIIAGNSKKADKESQITFAKYDPDGNEIFIRNYFPLKSSDLVEVEKVKVTSDNKTLITGSIERDGNIDFLTLCYNEAGVLIFEKSHNSENNSKDIATNIELSSTGEIMVIGRSISNESKYTTIKYQTLEKNNQAIYHQDGTTPSHKANEFIVKFSPQDVNHNFVNNLRRQYGTVEDILTPDAAYKITNNIELRGITFAKIYHKFSPEYTQSISRLGDTIPIPEVWSTFLVITPPGQDLEGLMNQFELMPSVEYTQPNIIYELTNIPNDEFLNADNQQSLFAQNTSQYPNANINMNGAWDIETGQDYTRVGVYDSGIYWAHEDFGNGTPEGSQIKGGYFYALNSFLSIYNSAFSFGNSHGTSVGGIIGALRNNNATGIAGIAGGGLDAQGNDNPGVQLFSMVVDFGSTFVSSDILTNAIMEGVTDLGDLYNSTIPLSSPSERPGLGLHIINASWGKPFNPDNVPFPAIDQVMYSAGSQAFRNHVLFVAAKGNGGTDSPFIPVDAFDDDWVLSVGASGTNGEYKDGGLNGDFFLNATPDCQWSSNYGGDIDVVAPGVSEVVSSLIGPFTFGSSLCPGFPAPLSTGTSNLTNYQAFNGTSAAAPHVTGVAALMHSLHNVQHPNKPQFNNLAPEDYEYMLQEYAVDITGVDIPNSPNELNGHGRVDATAVLEKLEAPNWSIWHSSHSVPVEVEENLGTTINGNVATTTFKVTHTYQNVFSPTTEIKAAWKRNSSVIGNDVNFDFAINGNIADVIVTMYFYKKELNGGGTSWENGIATSQAKSAYSLHLYNPNVLTGIKEVQLGTIKVSPNPTLDKIQLNMDLENTMPQSIRIFDLMGKMIYQQKIPTTEKQILEIDLSGFSSGIYFLHLTTDNGIYTSKIIKQ